MCRLTAGVQGVVDDLVDVARREDPLRARLQGVLRPLRAAVACSVNSPSRTVSTPEEQAVVVPAAALSGHPAQQPDLVAGAGAQPVVPAGGGVVADERGPGGAVGGDRAGQAHEAGDGGRVGRDGRQQVGDGERVAGDLEVLSLFMVR